jgi:von Willebrand factor type A domain
MVSLLPTFNPNPQDDIKPIEVYHEDLPQEHELEQTLVKNLLVIFIADRSGSMSGKKMDITKQALQLFIKSLPSQAEGVNTYFQILSFGTNFKYLDDIKHPLPYNQENVELATRKIDNFSANMSGTRIY